MSVTVKTAWVSGPFNWATEKDGSHVLQSEGELYVLLQHKKNELAYKFSFKKGFRCDGLSVPGPFRWFLKDWDEENRLYNLAGALHDWLYATEGDDRMFTRSECDDIFRGLLRESGIGRFKAGAADLAVGLFAGCRLHWGNDDYGIGDLVGYSVFV